MLPRKAIVSVHVLQEHLLYTFLLPILFASWRSSVCVVCVRIWRWQVWGSEQVRPLPVLSGREVCVWPKRARSSSHSGLVGVGGRKDEMVLRASRACFSCQQCYTGPVATEWSQPGCAHEKREIQLTCNRKPSGTRWHHSSQHTRVSPQLQDARLYTCVLARQDKLCCKHPQVPHRTCRHHVYRKGQTTGSAALL